MLYHLTHIPIKEILRLALGENPPSCISQELFLQAESAAQTILPFTARYHLCILPTAPLLEKYFPGNDIRRHLKGCENCVLLCATMGSEVDSLIRRAQICDMTKALFLDAAASAAIEQVCDEVQIETALRLEKSLTSRFSCGYGDFPLSAQKDFLTLCGATSAIGLNISPSGMLVPIKSVTAVMGILPRGASVSPLNHPCSSCSFQKDCLLRRKGVYCGKYTASLS